jgi:hypothetical protein
LFVPGFCSIKTELLYFYKFFGKRKQNFGLSLQYLSKIIHLIMAKKKTETFLCCPGFLLLKPKFFKDKKHNFLLSLTNSETKQNKSCLTNKFENRMKTFGLIQNFVSKLINTIFLERKQQNESFRS